MPHALCTLYTSGLNSLVMEKETFRLVVLPCFDLGLTVPMCSHVRIYDIKIKSGEGIESTWICTIFSNRDLLKAEFLLAKHAHIVRSS